MFPFRENNGSSNGKITNRLYEEDKCEVSFTNDLLETVDSTDEYPDIDDLDPSLFCPDIILELYDSPIIINNANPVQYTKIHCTACNDHLGSALSEQGNKFVHPLLKVMICGECYEFYTSGEFEKDEDGSEIHCRWCGQGGKVLCCSKCEFVFCTSCIRRNLGKKKLDEIKSNENWICFNCDPSQIAELRTHCADFMEYARKETSREASLANASGLMNVDYSQCCPKAQNSTDNKKKLRQKNHVDQTYDPYTSKNESQGSLRAEKNLKCKPKLKLTNVASVTKNPIRILPKSVLNPTSIAPSNFYRQPNLQIPSDQRITAPFNNTTNKTIHTSTHITNRKIVAGPSGDHQDQGDFQSKKLFYQKAMHSAFKINSDLFSDLTMVKGKKPVTLRLEEAAAAHNKLQDMLNKSVRSLMQLQSELAKFNPDHSNTVKKITQNKENLI